MIEKKRMRTGNRALMREWNTKLILGVIREQETTSQIEIFKKSGLSLGTVANITRQLKKEGFIKNLGRGKSNGGRKPMVFCFNSKAKYVISVALFAIETRMAILDLAGNILKKISFPTQPERGKENVFNTIKDRIEVLTSESSIPRDKIVAICISFEGLVNADTGSLVFSLHFGWRDVPVKNIFEEMLNLRTLVESDGRSMASGEYWFGAGKNVNNMVCVDIDAGIGVAIIANGRIYRGSHWMEGEIGHTNILADGPLCNCGKAGCLEAIASGSAILKMAKKLTAQNKNSSILKNISGLSDRQAIRKIFQAAEEGDQIARKIVQNAGYYLGLAIAGVVNYTDPELVVLTGYVSEEDTGILLKTIRESFQKAVFGKDLRKVDVVKGVLGEDAVLVGAAAFAYQELFTLPH
ncbi:MAG: ROK family transcriptional regulator [Candidatus Omnitrophota bacterium]